MTMYERGSLQHHYENIQRIYDLVKTDCRITTRIIAEKLEISNGSVQIILKEDFAWILHQDNALSHTAFVTREFLVKNNITTVDLPIHLI